MCVMKQSIYNKKKSLKGFNICIKENRLKLMEAVIEKTSLTSVWSYLAVLVKMTFYDPDFSIQYVFPLMKLSEKLGITPTINLDTMKIKSNKYYPSAAAAVVTLCSLLNFWDTLKMIPNVRGTSTVLEILWSIFDLLRSLVTIAVAYFRAELWDTFLNLFRNFDDRLNKKEQKIVKKDIIIVEIIFHHALLLGIFIYDSMMELSKGKDQLFFVKYIGYYHCFLSILVELHFASALRKRYKKINMLLLKTTDLQNILNNFIAHYGTTGVDNLRSIKEVTDYYLLLSELVDIFNKLFGWQIFLLTESTIIQILLVLNTVMLSLDSSQHSLDALHDLGDLFFVVAGAACLIFFQVMVILYCEDVNKESRNTLKICYNLQESVQMNSEEKKELAILCDVVGLLKTRTTASGFYTINKNVISRVFAYIFSYSIVLIQFSRQSLTDQSASSNETNL
ncbi:unnamed protein product [Acanthoscelides obtectus]|uniref:Gustatory receptor n=1 Tax=Acanthoscelides obtectus TaxID=200917 RepID=A0A9P0PS51_ACAOB|nr:unnamed protein product [Acanthoscelides obtectus]CAK1632200.1 hypothetical protein AOBTE_LOCUS7403 [Acanthoscelides obtectus]